MRYALALLFVLAPACPLPEVEAEGWDWVLRVDGDFDGGWSAEEILSLTRGG